MNDGVPSNDPALKEFADVLRSIWDDEKSHERVPFNRFCNNEGEITKESLSSAVSDYNQELKEINKANSKLESMFFEVFKDIKPSLRSSIGISEIIEKIDQKLHPEFYLKCQILSWISKIMQPEQLNDQEHYFICALCDIWSDEKQRERAPLGRFFSVDVKLKSSVDSALSDYPGISEEIKNALEEVLANLAVESPELITSKYDTTLMQVIRMVIDLLHPPVTRFEKARIVGARALQISYGAPILIEYPNDMLEPIDIALLEYKEKMIPITVMKNDTNR